MQRRLFSFTKTSVHLTSPGGMNIMYVLEQQINFADLEYAMSEATKPRKITDQPKFYSIIC